MKGATSVDPSATKVPADATFTVMVPGQKNKKSTVSLEARSKRGVAKAKVAVDTKAGAYTASGKSGNIRFRGTVSDLTEPFTIRGGGGARLTFSYTPSDAAGRSGTMTYDGHRRGPRALGQRRLQHLRRRGWRAPAHPGQQGLCGRPPRLRGRRRRDHAHSERLLSRSGAPRGV